MPPQQQEKRCEWDCIKSDPFLPAGSLKRLETHLKPNRQSWTCRLCRHFDFSYLSLGQSSMKTSKKMSSDKFLKIWLGSKPACRLAGQRWFEAKLRLKNNKLPQVKLRSTKSFLGKDIQLLITSTYITSINIYEHIPVWCRVYAFSPV